MPSTNVSKFERCVEASTTAPSSGRFSTPSARIRKSPRTTSQPPAHSPRYVIERGSRRLGGEDAVLELGGVGPLARVGARHGGVDLALDLGGEGGVLVVAEAGLVAQ